MVLPISPSVGLSIIAAVTKNVPFVHIPAPQTSVSTKSL